MPDTVRAVPIREEQAYGGIRVTLMGILHQARIPVQVDIGFGDVVTHFRHPKKLKIDISF